MSTAEPELRLFRAGDEARTIAGFEQACGAERSLDEWAWRYPDSPEGRPVLLALEGGRVLAHLGGSPSRVQLDGRVLAAAQLVEPFVLPGAGGPEARALMSELLGAFVAELGPGRRFDLVYRIVARPDGSDTDIAGEGVRLPLPAAVELTRTKAGASPARRLAYRAEPARDFEPRLDELWRRVRGRYPAAVVRDAEHALVRHAGHPTEKRHRFLVLPRFGRRALAFASFARFGDECRWLDLVWDRAHPGALELVAHVSNRLARQLGAARERVLLGGDPEGCSRLGALGFTAVGEPLAMRLEVAACAPDIDLEALASHFYLTACDVEGS
ncbi:MAG TPA: hypothetical protein VLT81_12920 [Chondromyces sp.]|nr:hypothetical protein [Chondromyces sp.]